MPGSRIARIHGNNLEHVYACPQRWSRLHSFLFVLRLSRLEMTDTCGRWRAPLWMCVKVYLP